MKNLISELGKSYFKLHLQYTMHKTNLVNPEN